MADTELPEKEVRELMKQNVFFRRMDCVYAPEENLRELLDEVRVQRTGKIFLLDDSSMRNASLYLRLCKLAKSAPEGALFPEGAVCCCRCAENCVRELVTDYFDVDRPSLGLYLFDLAELRVRKAFRRYPLWGNQFQAQRAIDPTLPAEQFNVHILIVGFGGVGEQFLRQTVNLGVAHSDSTILIDVVDQDAIRKKERFCSALELDDAFVGDNEIRVGAGRPGADMADGLLRIRFHEIDVRENRFSQFLRETAAEMPLTYAAVCIKDLDAGIRCISAIERYTADEAHPFPVAVKLECSEQLAEYLDRNDKTFGTVFAMDGIGPEKAFTLRDIYNSRTEKQARAYHEIYRSISFAPQGESVTPGAGWDELKLYQQQANRLLYCHAQTKAYVLARADSRDRPGGREIHLQRLGRGDASPRGGKSPAAQAAPHGAPPLVLCHDPGRLKRQMHKEGRGAQAVSLHLSLGPAGHGRPKIRPAPRFDDEPGTLSVRPFVPQRGQTNPRGASSGDFITRRPYRRARSQR